MKRNNNHGDRVAPAAKQRGRSDHNNTLSNLIKEPFCGVLAVVRQTSSSRLKLDLAARSIDQLSNLRSARDAGLGGGGGGGKTLDFFTGSSSRRLRFSLGTGASQASHQGSRLSLHTLDVCLFPLTI